MTKHPSSPCSTCPFRRDAVLGHWAREHFEMLLEAQTHHEPGKLGNVFACHKHAERPNGERGLCAGWLLDQKRDGLPSIALRMRRLTDPTVDPAIEAVNDGGLRLYKSVEAMCSDNIRAIDLFDERTRLARAFNAASDSAVSGPGFTRAISRRLASMRRAYEKVQKKIDNLLAKQRKAIE